MWAQAQPAGSRVPGTATFANASEVSLLHEYGCCFCMNGGKPYSWATSPSVSSSYVSVSLPRIRRYLPLLLHFPLLFMLTIRYLGEITNVLGLKIMKLFGDN